jgi:hypothetical protein
LKNRSFAISNRDVLDHHGVASPINLRSG